MRICLTKDLFNSDVYKSNGTCDELEIYAFSTHPTCYVENGFCTDILKSFRNLYCLVFKVFDFSDFFNELAIEQVKNNLFFAISTFNVLIDN